MGLARLTDLAVAAGWSCRERNTSAFGCGPTTSARRSPMPRFRWPNRKRLSSTPRLARTVIHGRPRGAFFDGSLGGRPRSVTIFDQSDRWTGFRPCFVMSFLLTPKSVNALELSG